MAFWIFSEGRVVTDSAGPLVNLGVPLHPYSPCLRHAFDLLLLPKKESFHLLLDSCSTGVLVMVGMEHP